MQLIELLASTPSGTVVNGSPGKDIYRSGTRTVQAGDYDAAITMINGNNTGGRSEPVAPPVMVIVKSGR